MLPLILECRGESARMTEDDIEKTIWEEMAGEEWMRSKGVRVSMGRWLSFLDSAEYLLHNWATLQMALLFMGVDMGYARTDAQAFVTKALVLTPVEGGRAGQDDRPGGVRQDRVVRPQ